MRFRISGFKGNWTGAKKGGDIQVTAPAQNAFVRRIMSGEITSSDTVHQELLKVMEWPSSREGVRVYGKTGVWGGAVWFNGFGLSSSESKAVTVLFEGSIAQRKKAIAAFYKQFEMKMPEPGEDFFK